MATGVNRNRRFVTAMSVGQAAGPWLRTNSDRQVMIAQNVVGVIRMQVLAPNGLAVDAINIAQFNANNVYDFAPPGAPYRFVTDGVAGSQADISVFPGNISGLGQLVTTASGTTGVPGADPEAVAVEQSLLKDANGVIFSRRREFDPFSNSWKPWENLDLEGNPVATSTPFTAANSDNVTSTDVFATDTTSGAIRPLVRLNNISTNSITFQDPITGAPTAILGTETVALRPQSVRIGAANSVNLIATAQAFAALWAAIATTEANYAVIRVNGPAAGAGVAYTTQGAAPTFGIGAGTGKEVNVGGEIALTSNADIVGFQAIGGDAGPYVLEIEVYNTAPGSNYG